MSTSNTILANSQITAGISVGDIIFYIILATLLVVVVVLCFLYTKSKKFKMKEEIKTKLENQVYQPPQIIKVEQKQINKLDDFDNY